VFKPVLLVVTLAAIAAGCAVTPETRVTEATPSNMNNCLATGTRIASKQRECSPAVGRSYSQEDLDRTGALTTAEALRRLDPAITSR
jgi:hypothetical protein